MVLPRQRGSMCFDAITTAIRAAGPLVPQERAVDNVVCYFESLANSAHRIPVNDLKILYRLINDEMAAYGGAPPTSVLALAFDAVHAHIKV